MCSNDGCSKRLPMSTVWPLLLVFVSPLLVSASASASTATSTSAWTRRQYPFFPLSGQNTLTTILTTSTNPKPLWGTRALNDVRGGAVKRVEEESEDESEDESEEESDYEEEEDEEEEDEEEEDEEEEDEEEEEAEVEEESVSISTSSKAVQRKNRKKTKELTTTYDEPLVPSPMLNLYVSLGVMLLAKRVNLFSPVMVRVARVAFIAYLIILQAFVLYVRIQAKLADDQTVITLQNPLSSVLQSQLSSGGMMAANGMVKNLASSFLSTSCTALEYDLKQANSLQSGLIFNMAMMWFLHFKMEQVQPLLIQAMTGILNMAYSPLFQVYVLHRNLQRPFVTTKPTSEEQPSDETEAEAQAEQESTTTTAYATTTQKAVIEATARKDEGEGKDEEESDDAGDDDYDEREERDAESGGDADASVDDDVSVHDDADVDDDGEVGKQVDASVEESLLTSSSEAVVETVVVVSNEEDEEEESSSPSSSVSEDETTADEKAASAELETSEVVESIKKEEDEKEMAASTTITSEEESASSDDEEKDTSS